MYSAGVVQEVFQRREEPWRWGAQWPAIRRWQWPIESFIEADPIKTTQEVAKEINVDHSVVMQPLKQIEKVRKFSKWVPHELTTNPKNCHLEMSFSLILCNNNEPFIDWIVMCNKKVDFIWQPIMISSVTGLRSSKALSKARLAPRKGHGHCLVVCFTSDPL